MTGTLAKGSSQDFRITFVNQVGNIRRVFIMLKGGTPQLKPLEDKGEGVFECDGLEIPEDCGSAMIGVEMNNQSKATLVIYDTE